MKKDGSILQMSRKYKLQLMLSLGSPNNYLRFWNSFTIQSAKIPYSPASVKINTKARCCN